MQHALKRPCILEREELRRYFWKYRPFNNFKESMHGWVRCIDRTHTPLQKVLVAIIESTNKLETPGHREVKPTKIHIPAGLLHNHEQATKKKKSKKPTDLVI